MGFRDISLFNQVMLSKQSWKIIKNPGSLLVKVLRGRYFKGNVFLKAPLGNNPSLVWRSILWGRDLFIKGYRWRVGDGRHIVIAEEPWINRKGCRTVLAPPEALKGSRVSSLFKNDGSWNERLIRESFIAQDADEIINIPLGSRRSQEEIIWTES